MKNNFIIRTLFFASLYTLLTFGHHDLFSQAEGGLNEKEIIVRLFETSTKKEIKNKKFYLERDKKGDYSSGKPFRVRDNDRIICKSRKYINMSVTVKNVKHLKQINLYLNDNRSDENSSRFADSLGTIDGSIIGKNKVYLVYTKKKEWTYTSRNGLFFSYFSKIKKGENMLEISIGELDEFPYNPDKYFSKKERSDDLTLTVDHYRDFNLFDIDDNSDLTIDVFMDDDGIVKKPN